MASLSPTEIVLEYVCPAFGVIAANLMFMAPFQDLQKAVSLGRGLGDLNPTPWAFMMGNCLGWSAYGIIISNWFVFWANYPGFLIACWLNLGAVKLLYSSHHREETRQSLVKYLSRRLLELEEVTENTDSDEDGDAQQQRRSLVSNGNGNGNSKNSDENDGERNKTTNNENVNDNDNDCNQHRGDRAETSAAAAAATSTRHDCAKIVGIVSSQTTPAKAPHERLIMGTVILWTVVFTVIGFYQYYATNDNDNNNAPVTGEEANSFAQNVVGYVVNLNLVFFYGAPLSSIFKVIRTKRSDTLHGPTMVMNTSNAVFWTAYALAPQIRDPFIYVPNGLGVLLGASQLALWAIFPKTKGSISPVDDGKEHTSITTTAILDGENNALEIAV